MAMSPVPVVIDSLMTCTYAFQVSGKPNLMEPMVHDVIDIAGDQTLPALGEIDGLVTGDTYLVRVVLPGKYDMWNVAVAASGKTTLTGAFNVTESAALTNLLKANDELQVLSYHLIEA